MSESDKCPTCGHVPQPLGPKWYGTWITRPPWYSTSNGNAKVTFSGPWAPPQNPPA